MDDDEGGMEGNGEDEEYQGVEPSAVQSSGIRPELQYVTNAMIFIFGTCSHPYLMLLELLMN